MKKNFSTAIEKLIDTLKGTEKELKESIAGVKEKYRKLIEEETASLNADLAKVKAALAGLTASSTVSEPAEEAEQQITDTIFQDNNTETEPEAEEQPEPKTVDDDEPVNIAEEGGEAEIEWANTATEEEESPESTTDAAATEQEETQEVNETTLEDTDEWPEFPEEWK